ncbi:MAG: hypothetical protein HY901_19785 [Deltaproteobacteria bacterium]|nr:hypothetical protein [Deltaproteobacteria bacterium]
MAEHDDSAGSGDSKSPKKKKKTDLLFVHGRNPKSDALRVIRAREDRIELGEMSDLKEGEPVRGEVVKLNPRKEHPQLFDVDVVLPREETSAAPAHAGPARVASEAYRDNFDRVFGQPKKRKKLLLN